MILELDPSEEKMARRMFIALHPPLEVSQKIKELLVELNKLNRGVKWVNEDSLHLTLSFLDWVEESMIDAIKETIERVFADSGPLEFEFGEIRALPDLHHPRVVYLECKQVGGQPIAPRQIILARELIKLGIEQEDRPWLAHLTLGRIKHAQQLSLVKNNLKGRRFVVGSVELMESTLTPSGPIYTEQASWKL